MGHVQGWSGSRKGCAMSANLVELKFRIARLDQRQDVMIAAMNVLADTQANILDALAELSDWLKQPGAPSELPELLRELITEIDVLPDRVAHELRQVAMQLKDDNDHG